MEKSIHQFSAIALSREQRLPGINPKTKTEFVRRALVDAVHDINKCRIRAIHKYLQFRSGKIPDLNMLVDYE